MYHLVENDLNIRNSTALLSGKFANVHELARAIGKDDAYVSRIIRLTLLAPEIIYAIPAGKLELSVPIFWVNQKKMFGIEQWCIYPADGKNPG